MTEEKAHIRPLAALICDDIRQEINKKEILIGVYSDNISVSKAPLDILVSLYIIVTAEGTGEIPLEINIIPPHAKEGKVSKGIIEILEESRPHQHIGLAFPRIPLTIQSGGDIVVKMKQHEEEPQIIKIIPVKVTPGAAKKGRGE